MILLFGAITNFILNPFCNFLTAKDFRLSNLWGLTRRSAKTINWDSMERNTLLGLSSMGLWDIILHKLVFCYQAANNISVFCQQSRQALIQRIVFGGDLWQFLWFLPIHIDICPRKYIFQNDFFVQWIFLSFGLFSNLKNRLYSLKADNLSKPFNSTVL